VGLASRALEALLFRTLVGANQVLAALPSRWVLRAADLVGDLVHWLDPRGRRVGRENLRVVFGDALTGAERRRILRASLRGTARSVAVLLHAAPLTPERFRRWVDVPATVEQTLRQAAVSAKGAVAVSGHLGSWELLLGMAGLLKDTMPTRFLVEPTVHPAVDRFLDHLRGTGGGKSALRKGGAIAMASHVRQGGVAALLVDRNARRNQGGIWVPFFGLRAASTPLPALLARRHDVPIVPLFCLPLPGGRYRIHLGPEPSMEVRSGDLEADVHEITLRIHRQLEGVIRASPEAWNWTLKRWKSRPTPERGDYPPYSLFDPE